MCVGCAAQINEWLGVQLVTVRYSGFNIQLISALSLLVIELVIDVLIYTCMSSVQFHKLRKLYGNSHNLNIAIGNHE